jgi:hypothetical protein
MSVDDGVDVCSKCGCYHCDDLICGDCVKKNNEAIFKDLDDAGIIRDDRWEDCEVFDKLKKKWCSK